MRSLAIASRSPVKLRVGVDLRAFPVDGSQVVLLVHRRPVVDRSARRAVDALSARRRSGSRRKVDDVLQIDHAPGTSRKSNARPDGFDHDLLGRHALDVPEIIKATHLARSAIALLTAICGAGRSDRMLLLFQAHAIGRRAWDRVTTMRVVSLRR